VEKKGGKTQIRDRDAGKKSFLLTWLEAHERRTQAKTGGELNFCENEHLSQLIGGDPFIVKT
jgi:hypothetical protein